MRTTTFQDRAFWRLTLGLTAVMELITIGFRLWYGQSAAAYIAATEPPWILQIHHMFWSVPFLLAGIVVSGRRSSFLAWSLALSLIASDLAHHFLVLPLWVGNTGWHWP